MSATLAAMVEQRCPLRIAPETFAGCCEWYTFLPGFAEAWERWFDVPPTPHQWRMAKQDWKAGNTGWEAAHNAQRRANARVESGAVYGAEAKAMARALIRAAAAGGA